jgi:K+ transporter
MPARKQADAGHLPHRNLGAAALACMGVVFGDIGTSPLYTLQVATKSASVAGAIAPEAVLGIVSPIFWSLIVVISIKYAVLIMRADNHGEGGILALLALVTPGVPNKAGGARLSLSSVLSVRPFSTAMGALRRRFPC